MAGKSSDGSRKRYHHGDLRRALVTAALDLIADGGTAALTLRAVARAAGVTHAAPYRHFDDKAALLAAVAEEGFVSLREAAASAAVAAGDDPVERLLSAGAAYVRFAVDHPAHYRVMFGAEVADRSSYPDLEAAADRSFSLLEDAITICQETGHVVEGNGKELALAAWSMLHGFASLMIAGQLSSWVPDEAVDELVLRLERILGSGIRTKDGDG